MFCIIMIYFHFRIVFLEVVASIFPSIWLLHYLSIFPAACLQFAFRKSFWIRLWTQELDMFLNSMENTPGWKCPTIFIFYNIVHHTSFPKYQTIFISVWIFISLCKAVGRKPQQIRQKKKKKRVLRININVKRENDFKQIQPNGFPRLLGSVQFSRLDILEGFSDFLPC